MLIETIDDPVSWVASHPERYFKNGTANAFELMRAVWMDAMLSSVPNVLVHQGTVCVVAGSVNWMVEESFSTKDLFGRITPLSAGGPNSIRSEILLNAFCRDVVAIHEGVVHFTKRWRQREDDG
jgi:hypothetical protein